MKTIQVGRPVFSNAKKSRGSFSFTFAPSGSSLSFYDFGTFKLDIGFLSGANSNNKENLRCGLYSGTKYSHIFGKVNYATLSDIQVEYKILDEYNDATEFGSTVTYTFRCHGAVVTDEEDTKEEVKVYYYNSNNVVAEGECDTVDEHYTGLKTITESGVTYTKVKDYENVG